MFFGEDGKCDYGSIFGGENCYFNLQRTHDIPYPEHHPDLTFYIHVGDVDAAYRRVTDNGWRTDHPPENQFWGGRVFTIRDINGFNLMFLQMVENPSLEEIRKRLKNRG